MATLTEICEWCVLGYYLRTGLKARAITHLLQLFHYARNNVLFKYTVIQFYSPDRTFPFNE